MIASGLDPDPIARVIAFYLPQFHAIPENDQWWGTGFTEWNNVRRARPWFDGHDQPKVPLDVGYYDLRSAAPHFVQAELARTHGIGGFCYYAYWFGGRRLLEEPLDVILSHPDLGMPYAICWANEPWTRRWDGSEDQVLMAQKHSPDSDFRLIDDLEAHLADPRYIRIDGRPLLLIYRAGLLVDPLRTTDLLRERAVKLGLGDLYLGMVQSFDHWDPIGYGFDAAVEFPPHGHQGRSASRPADVSMYEGFSGELREYLAVAETAMSHPIPAHAWFRGVMPAWDNTPRRGARATIYIGGSPVVFGEWLKQTLRFTYLFGRPSERIVFVNAWNEWGEGAVLEPDSTHGDAYLRAVSSAVEATRAYAMETAQIMSDGVRRGGLLDQARREWRARLLESVDVKPRR